MAWKGTGTPPGRTIVGDTKAQYPRRPTLLTLRCRLLRRGSWGAACWAAGRWAGSRPPPPPAPPARTAASGSERLCFLRGARPPRLAAHFSASSTGLSTQQEGSWGQTWQPGGQEDPGLSPALHPWQEPSLGWTEGGGLLGGGGRKPLGSRPGQRLSRPNPVPPSGNSKQPLAAASSGPSAGRPGGFPHSACPHPGP